MFDKQTDAFERLVCPGKLSNDHKQEKVMTTGLI